MLGTSGPDGGGRGLVPLCLADGAAAAALVRAGAPCVVVWCARARRAGDEPALLAGLSGVIAALPTDASLVYVSSDSVLAGRRGPYAERARPVPLPEAAELAPYVNAKLRGERLAAGLGGRALVVRPGPIYGRAVSGRPDPRTTALCEAWRAGRPTPMPVNLLRTWVHVRDLADTVLAAIDAGASGVLHAGPPAGMSHHALALALARHEGAGRALVVATRIAREDALRRFVRLDLRLCTARARAILGRDALDVGAALARYG